MNEGLLGKLRVAIVGDVSDLNEKAAGVSQTVGAVGGNLRQIGGTMTAIGTPAIAMVLGIGGSAISMENQFRDSTNNIQGALGLTEEGAMSLGGAVREIFGNNFGDSIAEVEQGVITAEQQFARLGGVGTDVMTAATEDAFRLKDAYDIDIAESLSATATLMDNFGLSQQQASDFLTSGFQNGLNASDDFLDSIGEYSNLFAENGFQADEFFSIMKTGAQGGVLGTDKIADAFKENGIIMREVSDDMLTSLDDMGLDAGAIYDGLKKGSLSVADATREIIPALLAMENPIYQNSAGVEIFGTMWEDLGASAFEALDLAAVGLEDMSGATEKLDEQYKDWPSMLEGLRRGFLDAFGPLSGTLLDVAAENMPAIQEAVGGLADQISANMPQIIEFVEGFIEYLATEGPSISQILAGIGVAFGLMGAAGVIGPLVIGLGSVISAIGTIIGFAGTLAAGVGAVTAAFGGASTMAGGLSAVLALIGGPITLVIAGVALLAVAWARDWGGIQAKTFAVIGAIRGFFQPFIDYLTGIWDRSSGQITAGVALLWAGIETIFGSAIDAVKLIWSVFTGDFTGSWRDLGVELRVIFDAGLTGIVMAVSGLWLTMKPYVDQFWADIQAWWSEIDWGGLGSSIVSGVAAGMDPMVLVNKVIGVGNAVMETFAGFFETRSPSEKMRRFAFNLPAGMGLGIEDGVPALESQATNAVRNVPNALARGLEGTPITAGRVRPEGGGRAAAGGHVVNVDLNGAQIYGIDDLQSVIRQAVQAALGEDQRSGATLNRALARGLI